MKDNVKDIVCTSLPLECTNGTPISVPLTNEFVRKGIGSGGATG